MPWTTRRVFLSTKIDIGKNSKSEVRNSKQIQNPKFECSKQIANARGTVWNFEFQSFEFVLDFEIRASDLLGFALVNHQFVSVGIAKLRHPANRRLHLFNIEFDTAFF